MGLGGEVEKIKGYNKKQKKKNCHRYREQYDDYQREMDVGGVRRGHEGNKW